MSRRARSASRRPRWHRRPDARPEEILCAALEVFSQRGFARTRLEEVARRAGVSKGTLYLYFDSKEALFRAMVRAKVESVLSSAEESVRTWEGDSVELLRNFIVQYWAVANEPAKLRLARLVLSELGNFPEMARWYYTEVILRLRRVIEAILARGEERKEFRALNRPIVARALQVLVVNLAQFRHCFQSYDPAPPSAEQLLEGIIDLYLHGVLPAPGGAAGES
jgi:AcrR family transcriptional regulator